ncbi:hypothetical protein NDU88_006188 [Pleurodeles waltl]|uniref:Uncharacterized protein n=1 Tax=Pleurodeles waltl TaxID=8319 RepID=A0AAV7QJD2_PLEWA|nr:hypothetical protein NDU88_006188 [Pleurodeles waltl]
MFSQSLWDGIPTGSQWVPDKLDPGRAQAKRWKTNKKASDRRTQLPDLHVGDALQVDHERERASGEADEEYGNAEGEVVADGSPADRPMPYCNLELLRTLGRPYEPAARSERYHLRLNPPPSQRLQDFMS